MEQFIDSDDEWRQIERASKDSYAYVARAVLELRDRVAALEAAPVRFIVRNESGVYQKAGTPVYLADPAPEVPNPEPEPSDFQTLHSVALDMVDSLGRSFHLLPEILDTLRRAIREPMAEQQATCKAGLQAADDLTPESEPIPSPAAGDAGLVKEVLDAMGEGIEADVEARAAIHAVARWLARRCSSSDGKESRWLIDSIQQILHEEANR